jgi:hypothetical protein
LRQLAVEKTISVSTARSAGWDPLRTTLRSYAQSPAKGDLAAKQNTFVLRYGLAA